MGSLIMFDGTVFEHPWEVIRTEASGRETCVAVTDTYFEAQSVVKQDAKWRESAWYPDAAESDLEEVALGFDEDSPE